MKQINLKCGKVLSIKLHNIAENIKEDQNEWENTFYS